MMIDEIEETMRSDNWTNVVVIVSKHRLAEDLDRRTQTRGGCVKWSA